MKKYLKSFWNWLKDLTTLDESAAELYGEAKSRAKEVKKEIKDVKKAAKNVTKIREEETHKPKDDFDFNLLEKIWKEYTLGLKKEGKKNIASILDMNKISLKDSNKILYSVSSEMHKVEINLEMKNLLPFLRERLNNHDITVEIVVLKRNKEESIYSPTEKYQYLKKINPLLDELKTKFDLNF